MEKIPISDASVGPQFHSKFSDFGHALVETMVGHALAYIVETSIPIVPYSALLVSTVY
jgi:hypothetical protein